MMSPRARPCSSLAVHMFLICELWRTFFRGVGGWGEVAWCITRMHTACLFKIAAARGELQWCERSNTASVLSGGCNHWALFWVDEIIKKLGPIKIWNNDNQKVNPLQPLNSLITVWAKSSRSPADCNYNLFFPAVNCRYTRSSAVCTTNRHYWQWDDKERQG